MDFSPFPRPALTHSSTLRRLLYEALAELGLDPTDTYRRVFGLAPSVPWLDGREDHDSAPRFWLAMAGMTGDDDIGLHLGEVMRPRPMDVMGYLLQAARDLRQGLEAFVRYQHVASGGFAARLEEHGEVARLVIDLHYVGVGHLRQQVECVALLLSRMLGAVLGEPLPLLGVCFRHPAPRRLAEHRRLFGVEPLFAQPHDALLLPRSLLARPLGSASPRVFEVLEREAERQLAELVENQLQERVRYWLALRLERGDCTLAACAQALGMTRSALQRSLAEQGTGFRALHDEVRRMRARELLDAGHGVREVARACGFAELSPFYRAFQRWEGHTPGARHLSVASAGLCSE
ncbi:AraC-like DNA-binding protein [Pseudomonas sp. SLBN-26]|jgi:AraC-like DNA-binding protein|uniref:AraC family transcriptional regulator n=1 Tax=Pseudomonadaceae TaxID=135621 RepID=UPI0005CA9C50|nr:MULTISPECIES: AraC family transcriptional regulator [Pseudomonas]KIV74044.1 Transcriptional regulator, AraC family [Pseudomonas sp. FeS53a]MCP1619161.1 AraC-like DNA-binding protein [Pseudomonas otitidis]MDG9781278.1 AraC family transcriptional regulator [Pseudomonas otitidis]MDH1106384.1 AraC family transcriptional regulator [Pseudomonas otitidis]MDH1159283.1 AraC family transcriptional regulator [Pseudomonas otitidis]